MRPLAPFAKVVVLGMVVGCGGVSPSPGEPGPSPEARGEAAPPAADVPAPRGADAAAPTPAGTYRIALERPVKVGAKYKRSVKVTDSRQELLVEGKKTLKESDHRVQITLVAAEEVLAVDAQGRWQKIALTTETFAAAGRSGDEPIVSPGTKLTIERGVGNDDAKVTSSSGELSKDAKKP